METLFSLVHFTCPRLVQQNAGTKRHELTSIQHMSPPGYLCSDEEPSILLERRQVCQGLGSLITHEFFTSKFVVPNHSIVIGWSVIKANHIISYSIPTDTASQLLCTARALLMGRGPCHYKFKSALFHPTHPFL